MKISLVIPTLRRNPELLEECINSFKGEYDELIIIDDEVASLAYKQNKGMRMATGDFIIVSNDDVVLKEGNLKDLCKEGSVLSPKVNGGVFKTFPVTSSLFQERFTLKLVDLMSLAPVYITLIVIYG